MKLAITAMIGEFNHDTMIILNLSCSNLFLPSFWCDEHWGCFSISSMSIKWTCIESRSIEPALLLPLCRWPSGWKRHPMWNRSRLWRTISFRWLRTDLCYHTTGPMSNKRWRLRLPEQQQKVHKVSSWTWHCHAMCPGNYLVGPCQRMQLMFLCSNTILK